MKQSPRLQTIQDNMQPGSISAEGFLGDDSRNLADIISSDQAAVNKLNITHAQIADKMQQLTDAGKPGLGRPERVEEIYDITVEDYRGMIPCPFQDSSKSDKRNTCALNIKTGEKYCWTDLSIHMIREHGFYEGRGSAYRLEPQMLAEFLGLIKQ